MENNFENPLTPESDVTQTPQQAVQKKSFTDSVKGFSEKLDLEGKSKKLMEGGNNLWNKVKAWPKKMKIMAAAAAAVLVVAIVLLISLSNTYKTPIGNVVKLANAKKFDKVLTLAPKVMNGFCESEIKSIINIAKKSDLYKDNKDDLNEMWEDQVVGMLKDQLGDNYKFSYKITDKEKLDKDDCEDIQDGMKDLGKMVTTAAKQVNKLDDDVWEEAEDMTGLKEKDLKKIVDKVEAIGDKMKKAKVTAGYELEVTLIVKGSELDEPMEQEININVIKVNGRWVIDFVSPLMALGGMLDLGDLMDMADMGGFGASAYPSFGF